MPPIPLLVPEYLHFLSASMKPLTPLHPLMAPMSPDTPYTPRSPQCPLMPPIPYLAPEYLHSLPAPIHSQHPLVAPQHPLTHLHSLVFYHCHFATEHLHKYVQFTIYHLYLSRIHLQYCEAQSISAISPKTCTQMLQLLHNTKRPTKWSGHGNMIDPHKNFYIQKTFYLGG